MTHRRGIDRFYLSDYDDNTAPNEKPVLQVAVSGDVTFLTLQTVDETHDSETAKTVAQIGVDTISLYNGLLAAMASSGWMKGPS